MSKRLTVSTVLVLISGLLVVGQAPASADVVPVMERNQTISTNAHNTCIVSTAMRVECWGEQHNGNFMAAITVPAAVADTPVISVETNKYNTCVLTGLGAAKCWGYFTNESGFDIIPMSGTTTDLGVVTFANSVSVSTSNSTACAVSSSGTVQCIGYSSSGYGSFHNFGSGIQVPAGLGAARLVSTNYYNTCVALVAGGVTCWGVQGLGGSQAITVPSDLGVVVSLSTNIYNTCVVTTSGAARCWGIHFVNDNLPQAVTEPDGLGPVASISTNAYNTCAVLVSGVVHCWGSDYFSYGQTPYGAMTVPAGSTRVVGISNDRYNTCAVKTSGDVICWGTQIADETNVSIVVPSSLSKARLGTLNSPEGVITQGSPNTLSVSWNQVLQYIRGHQVTYVVSAGSDALSCTTTTLTCDITGLTNGQLYSVTVTAIDDTRTSVPSVATIGVAIGPASAPTIASAVTGSGRVTLTIGAPVDLGDQALTAYEYSSDNGNSWTSFGSPTGPFIITGLTNGVTYQVKARAVNSWSAGEASAATVVIPTNLVPAAVSISSATAGDGSVALAITPPAGVTGASVSSYKYSVNNGVSWLTGSVAAGVMTVTGLHNGVQYSIKVRALNSNGNGPASTTVKAKPCALAGAPTITSIVSGNAKATVSFQEPDENGGTVVSNYQYSLNGGSTWITPTRKVTRSPLIITGLTNGTSYSVAMRAVTQAGSGTPSTAIDVTPATVPSAPSVSVSLSSVASTSANITIAASPSTGGSAVLSYAYTLNNGVTWVPVELSAIGSSIAVTGLTAYKSYSVKVRATNAVGSSLKSAAATFKTSR